MFIVVRIAVKKCFSHFFNDILHLTHIRLYFTAAEKNLYQYLLCFIIDIQNNMQIFKTNANSFD